MLRWCCILSDSTLSNKPEGGRTAAALAGMLWRFLGGMAMPDGFPVPLVLKRARRRTLAVHVFADRVEVRAPLKLATHEIDRFVQQKSVWIGRKWHEIQHRQAGVFRPVDQQSLSVMGQAYTLRWQIGAVPRVWVEGDYLVIAAPVLDESLARHLFSQWLRAEAKHCLVPMAEMLAERLSVRERLSGFQFRYTRSLWGRCSARGEILFNPAILMAPESVIEYLLVHEVCHLRHLNHSSAFWALVASVCPHWAESRRWLRQNGHLLHAGR